VSRDALATWLKASTVDDLFKPWDPPTPITCEHGQIDPSKVSEIRTISSAAFDKLTLYTPLADLQICPACVDAEFSRRLSSALHEDHMIQFDALNDEGGYLVPKVWLDKWRQGVIPLSVLPTDQEYTLFCEHGNPWDGKKMSISGAALSMLQSLFGPFRVFDESAELCVICLGDSRALEEDRKLWETEARVERHIKKHVDMVPLMFGVPYYIVPNDFYDKWVEWLKNPGARPELRMEYCVHGQVDIDPAHDRIHYVTAVGWDELCHR